VDTLTADLTHYKNGVADGSWEQYTSFRGVSEGDMTRFALVRKEPLLAEHEAFRDAILTGDTSHIVTLEAGARVVKIAEDLAADGVHHRIAP